VHIRSDRRHIQERDLELLSATVKTHLNVEMALTEEMLEIATRVRPHSVSLVPERPEELTTEGGLDVASEPGRVAERVAALQGLGISAAIFIDPALEQIEAAATAGADQIEINTAGYAEASEGRDAKVCRRELERVRQMAAAAADAGLRVAAGHGLTYRNVGAIVAVPQIAELNIGHNIVARAALVGLRRAVRQMKALTRR